LLSGKAKSREEIATANGISGQHVARLLPLAWPACVFGQSTYLAGLRDIQGRIDIFGEKRTFSMCIPKLEEPRHALVCSRCLGMGAATAD
jgi:hypothetical protein